jgi:hypothetical protein
MTRNFKSTYISQSRRMNESRNKMPSEGKTHGVFERRESSLERNKRRKHLLPSPDVCISCIHPTQGRYSLWAGNRILEFPSAGSVDVVCEHAEHGSVELATAVGWRSHREKKGQTLIRFVRGALFVRF